MQAFIMVDKNQDYVGKLPCPDGKIIEIRRETGEVICSTSLDVIITVASGFYAQNQTEINIKEIQILESNPIALIKVRDASEEDPLKGSAFSTCHFRVMKHIMKIADFDLMPGLRPEGTYIN